jgi:hypothetical protein
MYYGLMRYDRRCWSDDNASSYQVATIMKPFNKRLSFKIIIKACTPFPANSAYSFLASIVSFSGLVS